MRFFDHFGYFGHGHAGVIVAIGAALFAALIGGLIAMRGQKTTDD